MTTVYEMTYDAAMVLAASAIEQLKGTDQAIVLRYQVKDGQLIPTSTKHYERRLFREYGGLYMEAWSGEDKRDKYPIAQEYLPGSVVRLLDVWALHPYSLELLCGSIQQEVVLVVINTPRRLMALRRKTEHCRVRIHY